MGKLVNIGGGKYINPDLVLEAHVLADKVVLTSSSGTEREYQQDQAVALLKWVEGEAGRSDAEDAKPTALRVWAADAEKAKVEVKVVKPPPPPLKTAQPSSGASDLR